MDSNGFMTESAHTFLKAVALEAKKNGGGRPQALAQWRARISAAIVWERRPGFSGAGATLPSRI